MLTPDLHRHLWMRVALVVVVAALVMVLIIHRESREEIDELLDAQLQQVSATLRLLGPEHLASTVQPAAAIDGPASQHNHFTLVLSDTAGRRTLTTPGTPSCLMADREEGLRTLECEGERWRVQGAWFAGHEYFLQVAQQLDERDEFLQQLNVRLLTPLLALLPLLGFALAIGIRRALQPLHAITAVLGARPVDAVTPLALDGVPAEVRPLLDAFNASLLRVARALGQERRFTADAAHEMRTPLAGLRLQAEVALASTGAPERERALRQVVEGADRLTAILDQLLLLARLDEQDAPLVADTVDFSAMIRSCLATLAPALLARQLEVDAMLPAVPAVQGQRDLLELMVRNLLDNAIRHSPAGATLSISMHARNGEVAWVIENPCEAMSADQVARLGERFFRAAPQAVSGTGLGLSLVRRIADLHGARLQVDCVPGPRFRVEVCFTRAD